MPVSTAHLREFVRKVFRDATTAGSDTDTVLDTLSDAAFTVSNKGKVLTSTTDEQGISASWQMLKNSGGYDRQIEMIDAARDAIGAETDVAVVVASIVTVNRVGVSFRRYGDR